MQIVILCGGLGTRMREISAKIPKGMLVINTKPFIHYLLDSISGYHFTSIHFCLGYHSDQYISYLRRLELRYNITYTVEDSNSLLGTGGAIKNALPYLDKDFVIQYGDTILNCDYNELFDRHITNKKSMTMTVMSSCLSFLPPNLYCTKTKEGEMKCTYNKKNPPINANYIDYGASVFKRILFEKIDRSVFDLGDEQSRLSVNNEASFKEIHSPFIEIGSPSSYENAKLYLK